MDRRPTFEEIEKGFEEYQATPLRETQSRRTFRRVGRNKIPSVSLTLRWDTGDETEVECWRFRGELLMDW